METAEAKVLKIDITKLRTVSNYAKETGFSRVWVYQLGKDKLINIIEIDGVKFVNLA